MARQIVFTPKAAKPPPAYSQAVKAAGLVFVSGTAPTDPATGAIKGATVQEQTRQCLTNIQAILEAAGSSLDKNRQRYHRACGRGRLCRHERGMAPVVPVQPTSKARRQVTCAHPWPEGLHCSDC